jgi:hypothetical protein
VIGSRRIDTKRKIITMHSIESRRTPRITVNRLATFTIVFFGLLPCAFRAEPVNATAELPAAARGLVGIPIQNIGNSAQILSEWLLVGPIKSESCADIEKRLFPVPAGESLTSAIESIAKVYPRSDATSHYDVPQVRYASRRRIVDMRRGLGQKYYADEGTSVQYAIARLRVGESKRALLQVASDDGMQIWINGERVMSSETEKKLSLFQESLHVDLRKGDNIIIVRVTNYRYGSGFAIQYQPSNNEAIKDALRAKLPFLVHDHSVKHNGLYVKVPAVPSGCVLDLTLRRVGGEVVGTYSIANDDGPIEMPEKFEDDAYVASIGYGEAQCEQYFLSAPPEQIFEALSIEMSKMIIHTPDWFEAKAAWTRAEILLRPENTRPADPGWREKITYTLANLSEVVSAQSRPARAVLHRRPGLRFFGFKSDIDGAERYYRVHLPIGFEKMSAVPLLVVLPTTISAQRPFLESPFAASHSEAIDLGEIAQRYGIAIVWSGYPSVPFGRPIEFGHLEEVIGDLSSRIRVDVERVSLYGTCSAGTSVAMASVIWPKRFASVVLHTPNIRRTKNSASDEDNLLMKTDAASKALVDSDPFTRFAQQNIPVLITHDGGEIGHGPLPATLEYLGETWKCGRVPTVAIDYRSSFPEAREELVMKWVSEQRRELPSSHRSSDIYSRRKPGSIACALAEPFALVVGTRGTKAQQLSIRNWAERFRAAWKTATFHSPDLYTDAEITEEQLQRTNLVLFGNIKTNTLWARVVPESIVSMEAKAVTIGGKEVLGTNLSLQAVVRSKEASDRVVVLIGGASVESIDFGTLDLSVDGWFDFSVWDNNGGKSVLLEAGEIIEAP